MTQNEIALKILNMGKDGYKNDAEGFEKLHQANDLIEKHVKEQLRLYGVADSADWKPTMYLRWYQHINPNPGGFKKYPREIQQKWIKNNGDEKWECLEYHYE